MSFGAGTGTTPSSRSQRHAGKGRAVPATEPTWQEQGNCWKTDPAVFFAPGPDGWPTAPFLICADCPVTDECLEFALTNFADNADRGVWGGTTAREHRRIRAERAA